MDSNENKVNENKVNENGNSMRKAEALGILARLAERHDLAPEEVVAIQVAFRATAKRLFDRKRGLSRRFAARRAATGAATKEGGAE